MEGFSKLIKESHRLEELEKELKSAHLRGEKKCIKCGFCCHKRTCIPTPNELKKIAEFLKLTPKELINKFYAIDIESYGGDYYVKPVGENTKDLAGKFIPTERTWNEGKCIFLDEKNHCKIYPVRPISAKLQKCWENETVKDESPTKFWKDKVLEKEFKIKVEKNV